jgi:hypothetical protein
MTVEASATAMNARQARPTVRIRELDGDGVRPKANLLALRLRP